MSQLGFSSETRITGGLYPVAFMKNRLRKLGLVGARGFEPPTPASRTQCATGLRYAPTRPSGETGRVIVLQDRGKRQPMSFRHTPMGKLPIFEIDSLGQPWI
jgi:hypothetical protein